MMLGLMQDRPLLISTVIEHAAKFHPAAEIVSRTAEGPIHRCTYADIHRRSKQLANALTKLGVQPGERVASLAWNGYRHMEMYFGVSGTGAVLHTINPRLFPEQIEYIANHAEDQFLFFDLTFLPIVEKLAAAMKSVKGFVLMTDRTHLPAITRVPNLICYEDLIGDQSSDYDWPQFDENTASSLCYTSGTTGNPKGVLYSHRSSLLHSMMASAVDGLGLGANETALLIVPMFHVNAWGMPYAGALCGAKLVMPGPAMDGKSVYELMRDEKVTLALGVPTVWLMLFQHVDANKLKAKSELALKRVVIGGSSAPRAMSERFEIDFGAFVIHAWGMTEMSPLGTVCNLLPKHRDYDLQQRLDIQAKQGRGIYGVELRITDDEGNALPHDGKAFGHLMVRGPWIVSSYYRGEGGKILDADGYFDTGDVATIDADGYMQITDRSKDVIKSGGEWISSIDLENAAMGHAAVAEAAVIGAAHSKWQERPLLIIVKKPGQELTREGMLQYLDG
ncbi:MAG: long-chain-fatty-acid--CoA ligase, partial [Rhodocyclaceae bacterium]|nr:long-chain-fatty-acid--CoA ligase [Rhodocyclaceae bacterium]